MKCKCSPEAGYECGTMQTESIIPISLVSFSVQMYVARVNAKLHGKVRSAQVWGICPIIARKLCEKKAKHKCNISPARVTAQH